MRYFWRGAVVRVLELTGVSYKIIRQVIKDMPEGPVTVKASAEDNRRGRRVAV